MLLVLPFNISKLTHGTVQITLKTLAAPGDEKFVDRQFTLSKDKRSINIGRSSNRNAELAAAADNVWVDAPTMSREHAKLIFIPDKKVRILSVIAAQ